MRAVNWKIAAPCNTLACEGLIKPDIVFFGEDIPVMANKAAFELAETWT